MLKMDEQFAGSEFGGEKIPNISTHRVDGIGRWSASDIEYFLDIGMLPDGDFGRGCRALNLSVRPRIRKTGDFRTSLI